MVTLAEFDKVQLLLGREGKPRPKTHEFPFTGIIKCGECGCSITAINKTKIIKATGAMKTFTYYYCTRRSLKGKTCSQKLYISGDELERQIEQEILNVSILPDFKDWALGILREEHQSEVAARNTIYESQERTISEARKQLDNLTSLRLKDLIDDTEFADRRTELQSQITELSERLRQTLNRGNDWVKLMEQGFEFAANAHKAFLNGDLQTKKELMLTLGQNYILMDRKLELSRHFWLEPFFTKMPTIQNAFESVRTKKYSSPARQKAAFAALRPLVRE